MRRVLAALTITGLALVPLASVPAGAQGPPTTPTADRSAGLAVATADPVALWAPPKATATVYEGEKRVYVDLGVHLVAQADAFEIWSTRPSYDKPIVSQWVSPAGAVTLPTGSMRDFQGLRGFLKLRVKDAQGTTVAKSNPTVCLNGDAERARPDAPSTSDYPYGCPYNPYTLGSVQGIQAGWSTNLTAYMKPMRLDLGTYTVTATIGKKYVEVLGLDPAATSRTIRLTVREDEHSHREGEQGPGRPGPRPAAQEPAAASGGRIAGPVPDLRSLPAWGIAMNPRGTAIRFAATVWNGGDSPLVVDGFRSEGEQHMDAYQYFFDTAGTQTGYQQVGEMNFHGANHQHWHFEDFARYRLLNPDGTPAVRSSKRSFCLANTDAVDYTLPAAEWSPENTDLATACGGPTALSIREVLAAGSGDTYQQFRAGQAFVIKNLPNGKYLVAVEANPEDKLVESDTTNNVAYRTIWLRGSGAERRVVVAPIGDIEEPRTGY